MKRNKVYSVRFNLYGQTVDRVDVLASSKEEAYIKAVYEAIPALNDGELPYSAWVESVTFQNGNYRKFNTFEGKPY